MGVSCGGVREWSWWPCSCDKTYKNKNKKIPIRYKIGVG